MAEKINSKEENLKWAKETVAARIAENLIKESESIKEYLPLIQILEDNNFKGGARMIREIIADEKNHIILLMGLIREFDGNIPNSNRRRLRGTGVKTNQNQLTGRINANRHNTKSG
ncbi:MAG: hypothetical protein LBJ18_03690 [Rickettsiales bacterium]|jgi:bacterioferritin (cytochrome b1)|nr:hypothetical protein [Rickettsiales bacterium]